MPCSVKKEKEDKSKQVQRTNKAEISFTHCQQFLGSEKRRKTGLTSIPHTMAGKCWILVVFELEGVMLQTTYTIREEEEVHGSRC